MRITLIRTEKPDFTPPRRCSSAGFEAACKEYAETGIVPCREKALDPRGRSIYVSEERCCLETAAALFGDTALTVTPLLNSPPLSAFTDTARELPFSLWRGMAYLQWLFGNKRQKESRAESRKRAGSIIDRILSAGENAIVIADERMLSLLIAELKSRRYQIRRGGLIRIDHLERIIASDNEPHCGGCMYNCRLANPGCMIGRDKAKRAAQKQHT